MGGLFALAEPLKNMWGTFPTSLFSSGIWHVENVPHMFFNGLLTTGYRADQRDLVSVGQPVLLRVGD